VFGIDDAHWIDSDSWSFLLDLALDVNAILILATRPLDSIKDKHPAMIEILNHPHTKLLPLKGLDPNDMIALACSLLEVDLLPDALKQIIRDKSHGVPLWCEELVETMLELEYLTVVQREETITEEVEKGEKEGDLDATLVAVKSTESANLLKSEKISCQASRTSTNRRVVLKSNVRRSSVAQLSSGIGIGDIPIPDSVTGMVLTRIDHMSPSEQMTLKCAAVVGMSFSRTMLKSVIPNCNPYTFHKSLNVLAEAGIIECAIAAEVRDMNADISSRSQRHLPTDGPHLHCPCLTKTHNKTLELRPKSSPHNKHHIAPHPPVDECEMFHFVHAYVQETAYGLWTESQRRALHESAAIFLDSQAHKCKNCGGGGFVAGVPKQSVHAAGKRRKSTAPPGRAFVGAANMKNKLRRSTIVGLRRDSRISAQGSVESTLGSLTEIRRMLESRQGRRRSSFSQNEEEIEQPVTAGSMTAGVRYESICAVEALCVDLQDCHCDEIQAHIYPQLVRHWRAAGDMHKTLEYITEAASAAISTFSNMEALSLLHEAKHILEELGYEMITDLEHARIESLIGQVLEYMKLSVCMIIYEILSSTIIITMIIILSSVTGSVPMWRDWRISSSLSQCTQSSTHSATNPHHHQCSLPGLPRLQAAATHQVPKKIPSQKDWSRLTNFSRSSQVHGTRHPRLPSAAQEYKDIDGSFEAAECC
jgi:adenylate cyclase 10